MLSYSEFEPQSFAFQLCPATPYGEMQGIVINNEIAIQCVWWLRTPGIHDRTATVGSYNLGEQSIGMPVDYENAAVRPCMNIEY